MINIEIVYIWLVNSVAAFYEGGFGCGGSLIFLSLLFPLMGWQASVFTDCLLAVFNLGFTAWLYREELNIKKTLLPSGLLGVFPLIFGTLIFHFLSPFLRIVPLLLIGVILLWAKPFRLFGWYPAAAALSIGLSNTEASFGYMYFQSEGKGVGNTAFFAVVLLSVKIGILILLWKDITIPGWPLLVLMAFSGLPFTLLGKNTFSKFSQKSRQVSMRVILSAILIILIIGGVVYGK
jgi:hypothetical protein